VSLKFQEAANVKAATDITTSRTDVNVSTCQQVHQRLMGRSR
jgi:hypothetical protein